jgi:hypothetical protein
MIQQTISAPRWWKQMSLLVLLAFFKMGTRPRKDYLWMPSPPWRNSVGSYIILGYATTDDSADNFCSMVFARLVGLLQDDDSDVRRSSVNNITSLAEFGTWIYRFGVCED